VFQVIRIDFAECLQLLGRITKVAKVIQWVIR
jgi:hypothetical protein